MPFWKCFPCLRFPAEENITELDYSNGTLTNVPPDVSQFERTLEELYLSSNRISDLPPELFYCQGLRVLKLNDNELESIPIAIGSLKQLQTLDLSRNALTNIPDNIKSCKNLTHLDLSLNNLQRLPDAITNLISLQELLLNETYLEFLPANFGRLINLRILELRSNNLITLPKSMSRLTELTRIDIGANEFTELPEVIGQLVKLRELWIDCNRIRRVPSNISNLRELIHFEASNNQLTIFSNEICNWRNLEVLSLSSNDLETLPFSIGMLKRLVTLKCDSNQLKELPDSICHLEQLEELVINQNFITRLPSTIGLLRKMKFLIADENLLRKLPNEISSCINISVLSLRGNKLTELPHDIGHLKNLRVINVVDNLIRSLPVSVLNLTNLSALWISDNQSQPLVPLQYADNATKAELTCFMLPQLPGHTSANMPDQNTAGRHSGWYQEIQVNSTSPSRRICFADEANEKTNDMITTRLLRSPTPYPKELRQMAKFAARNTNPTNNVHVQFPGNVYEANQQVRTEVKSSVASSPAPNCSMSATSTLVNPAISHHIKEAKVLHNSQLVNISQSINHPQQIQQTDYDPSLIMPSTPTLEPSCDNLTNVQFLITGASTPTNNSIESAEHYANRPASIPLEGNYSGGRPHQQYQPFDNYYETLNIKSNGSVDYADSKQHGLVNKMATTTSTTSSLWSQTPTPSRQQDMYLDQNFHTHSQIYRQESQQASNYLSSRLPYPDQIYPQRPQEPPPYHIAKAYTKKSQQDLLTYDSIRKRNNSIEFLNNTNSRMSSPQYDSHAMNTSPPPLDNDYNNYNCANSVSMISNNNNNNDDYSENNNCKNVSLENGVGVENMTEDEVDQSSLLDTSSYSNRIEYNQQAEPLYQQICASERKADQQKQQSNKPKSSPWLFGLHRNPTVKQVMLKKDPTLGFEIKEIANRGIFVSNTMPNTTADELLQVDDKILDVDGIDFSKINHRDAQQILVDSGPVLNIMISRT